MRKLQLPPVAVKKIFKFVLNRPITMALFVAAVLISTLLMTNYHATTGFYKVSAAPVASATPKQQGCCGAIQPTLRRMIGTYYNVENGMASTLTLNNKGPRQIAVTPILYNLEGRRFVAAAVTVAGESSQNVGLGILATLAGPDFGVGSFEFTYEGRMLEMGGGLRIVDEAKSLIFDEQMLEPGMKFSSPQIEAVYSIPFDSMQVSVVISNRTDKVVAIKGDASFADSKGHHPISGFLKPYQTSVVKLPQGLVKNAKAGAVTLLHDGAAGALLAIIHVQEPDKGFSAAINFTDPGKSKTNQYHGAGLRLGSINGDKLIPIIAVRNLGNSATVVNGRIPFTNADGSEGKVELQKIELAVGEVNLISVPGIPRSTIVIAGLELEYEGAPGSVIADALSVSGSGNQVFTLPLKDPQGGLSSTGGYPWFINGSASTVVFIKNTTKEPQQFHLDIVYAGGRWGSDLRTLVAGQTTAFDVRKIRDEQQKGVEGNVIPINAISGHISWSVRGKGNKTFIGRAQTVDFVNGLASTYECQCVCPSSFYNSRLLPGSITGFIGDTQQFLAQEQDINCFNAATSWYSLGNAIVFSSDQPGVATINSSGLSTAVGIGSTLFHATWNVDSWYLENPETGFCNSTTAPTDCTASCEVKCRIPTGETIASAGWDTDRPTAHIWRQTLLPTNVTWIGRQLREVNYATASDSCWFTGSEIAKASGVSSFDPFTLSSNMYDDVVGWSPNAVAYYRTERPMRSLSLPCSYMVFQEMEIFCNPTWNPFVQHVLVGKIDVLNVESHRGSSNAVRVWP